MERRNLALLCAGVLCFWLFALAFGTAESRGVAVQAELPRAAPAAVEDVPVVDAARSRAELTAGGLWWSTPVRCCTKKRR